MPSFPELLQQGAAHAWLFAPTAILLGALHGLEPGHSKTMMAAFIVAIRGSVGQAVLLGLAAAASHSLVVWAVALAGLRAAGSIDAGAAEPWFQLASGAIVVAVAAWMLGRTWRDRRGDDHHHDHDHDHDHDHSGGLPAGDAHARAHAAAIGRRFAGRPVTTWQIVLFGLTGGLIPCPAAITVLLICLQLRQISLGIVLVLCFSIGLAVVMVAVGVAAALGTRHAGRRWSGAFDRIAQHAPYASGLLILLVGLAIGIRGWAGLPG